MNIKTIYNINNQIAMKWTGYSLETMRLVSPASTCLVRIRNEYNLDIDIILIIDYKHESIISYSYSSTPFNIAQTIKVEYEKLLEERKNKENGKK